MDEVELNKAEKAKFIKSAKQMKKVYDEVAAELGIE